MNKTAIFGVGVLLLFGGSAEAKTLDQVIEQAVRTAPSGKASEENYKAARVSLWQAWMALFPAASVSRGFMSDSVKMTPDFGLNPLTPPSGSLSYGFSVPLLDVPIFFNARAADVGLRIQDQSLRSVRNGIALQATQSYVSLVAAELKLIYFAKILTYLQKLHDSIDAKDPLRNNLQGDMAILNGAVLQTKLAKELAVHAYQKVVGEEYDGDCSSAEEIGKALSIPLSESEAIQKLLAGPQARIARYAIEGAKAGKGAAISAFFPKLSYRESWAGQDQNYSIGGHSGSLHSDVHNRAVVASVTLSAGMGAEVKKAKHQVAAAEFQLRDVENALVAAAKDAYSQDRFTLQDLEVKGAAISKLLKAFQEEMDKIEKGQAVNVQAAEGLIMQVTQAYVEVVSLAVNLVSNRALLLSQIGILAERKGSPSGGRVPGEEFAREIGKVLEFQLPER